MSKPVISIIIASYNVQDYISECVSSALNQTMRDIEVIIVDDGSTDDTFSICEKIAKSDKRVVLFKQKNDGAPGKARNRGIELSRGKYLIFLDSDDYLSSNCCEILYSTIVKDNSDIVTAVKMFFNSSGECLRDEDICFKSNLTNGAIDFHALQNTQLHNYLCWNAQAKLFNKSIIMDCGIDFPEKIASQDTVFTAKYLDNINKISIIDDIVYYRREREDHENRSLTQSNSNSRVLNGRIISFRLLSQYFYQKNNYIRSFYYYKNAFNLNKIYEEMLISNDPNIHLDIDKLYHDLSLFKKLNNKYQKAINNRWYRFSKMSRVRKIRFLIHETLSFVLKILHLRG